MNLSRRLIVLATSGILTVIALFAICGAFAPSKVAQAGLCDLLSDEIVKFYEEEIAKEAVLSNKSGENVRAIAARFGIDEQKARCAILLFDLANRTGGGIDFPEIAKMSEFKMLAFAKQRGEIFSLTLPPSEKARLKQRASELIGIRL